MNEKLYSLKENYGLTLKRHDIFKWITLCLSTICAIYLLVIIASFSNLDKSSLTLNIVICGIIFAMLLASASTWLILKNKLKSIKLIILYAPLCLTINSI